jgi:predicted DNA-binding antitoxin AbrB/MazE fold protein
LLGGKDLTGRFFLSSVAVVIGQLFLIPDDAKPLPQRCSSLSSGPSVMSFTVEAVYENGTLKLAQPLPLKEQEKVRVTVEPASSRAQATAGLIPCSDPELIERIALEPLEEL